MDRFLEYVGWALEAIGALLVGWEALFRRSDRNTLRAKLNTILDPALAGVEWDENGHVLKGDPQTKEALKQDLEDALSDRAQTAARLGVAAILIGLALHVTSKLLE